MRTIAIHAATLGIALAALGLAGCDGQANDAAYLERFDAISDDLAVGIQAADQDLALSIALGLNGEESAQALEASLAALRDAMLEASDELSGVTPPTEVAELHEQYIDTLTRTAESLDEMVTDVQGIEVRGNTGLLEQLNGVGELMEERANAFSDVANRISCSIRTEIDPETTSFSLAC